ncbi:MAG TPA: hypothetical protein VMV05_05570 [bacterium]|nr:hypothetical protein [bacterium]
MRLEDKDRLYLQDLGVRRLYVHFFDLEWDIQAGRAVPSNEVRLAQVDWLPTDVVPVVYISQEALHQLKVADFGPLAEGLLQEIQTIQAKMGLASIPEIQMDCDWTPAYREIYFGLLRALEGRKGRFFPGVPLSVTLRLHQVKYSTKAGVPPVERGALMVYHTSTPFTLKDGNSILSLGEAKSYLADLGQYRLPLDIALPIFSWVVQFNRYGKFLRILHETRRKSLDRNPALRKKGDLIYEAALDTFLGDSRVMKGDLLKWEQADLGDILSIEKYLRKRLHNCEINLILFDYDSSYIGGGNYGSVGDIKEIFKF